LFPGGAPSAHVAAAAVSGVLLALVYAALAATVRDRRLRVFWLAAFAATIFWCGNFYLTPDLLQAALVLPLAATLYLAAVRGSLRLAALAGAWAALVYLAKCYGFPWSIGASLVVVACPASRRPKAVAVVYLAAFLLSSLPWLLALHAAYGHWMFCHAGR